MNKRLSPRGGARPTFAFFASETSPTCPSVLNPNADKGFFVWRSVSEYLPRIRDFGSHQEANRDLRKETKKLLSVGEGEGGDALNKL